jgi:5-methylcytosine-specific restriction enzyme A
MKRGKPLGRGKPLKRGKPPVRRAPLKATASIKPGKQAALKAAPKKATGRQSTGPDRLTVDAIYERDGWSCFCCGGAVGPERGEDHHIHHRRPRAMGGTNRPDTNSPANLLLLCPDCHRLIESERVWALQQGLLLVQADDPALVAVRIHHAWPDLIYLTADAQYSRTPPSRKDTSCPR